MSIFLPLFAAPVLHFARLDERIRVGTYNQIDHTPSAHAVWRRRTGNVKAWTFSDRRAIRSEHREDGELVEVVRYDITGRAESRVRFDEGSPVQVFVDGGTLDVRGWDLNADLPLPSDTGASVIASLEAPSADVFDPAFAASVEEACGCRLHSGATTWIGGRPAARFTAELRGEADRRTAELWAIPGEQGTLLVASGAADWDQHTVIRAAMALVDLRL